MRKAGAGSVKVGMTSEDQKEYQKGQGEFFAKIGKIPLEIAFSIKKSQG